MVLLDVVPRGALGGIKLNISYSRARIAVVWGVSSVNIDW